jgi:hypothetical protein
LQCDHHLSAYYLAAIAPRLIGLPSASVTRAS